MCEQEAPRLRGDAMSAQVAVFSPSQGSGGGAMVPVISMLAPDSAGSKSSKYKGVHWDKTKAKWVGYIHMKGKKHHLGYFPTEEEAARAYDRESLRCRGFTKNFPRTDYPAPDQAQEPEQRKVLEKSSRFTGVSWNKLRRKWAARIIVDGRSQHMGHFAVEADAARAYDRMCFQSRGNTKNFPAEEYAEFFVNGVPKQPPASGGKSQQQGQAMPGALVSAGFVAGESHHQQVSGGMQPLALSSSAMHHQPIQHIISQQPGHHQQHPQLASSDHGDQPDPKAGLAMEPQPRLFVVQGSRGAGHQGLVHEASPPSYNLYTTYTQPGLVQSSVTTHQVPSIAYQTSSGGITYQQAISPSWASPPASSQPQLVGYTGLPPGFASLLQQPSSTQGDTLVLQPNQSLQASKPYTFMTSQGQQATMIPASLLPNLLQQPPSSNNSQATVGMAQLQALVMQNQGVFSQQQQGMAGLHGGHHQDVKLDVGHSIIEGQPSKRLRTDASGVVIREV